MDIMQGEVGVPPAEGCWRWRHERTDLSFGGRTSSPGCSDLVRNWHELAFFGIRNSNNTTLCMTGMNFSIQIASNCNRSRSEGLSGSVWGSKLVSKSQVVFIGMFICSPFLGSKRQAAHRPIDACKIFFICSGLEKLLVIWSQAPVDTCESSPLVPFVAVTAT